MRAAPGRDDTWWGTWRDAASTSKLAKAWPDGSAYPTRLGRFARSWRLSTGRLRAIMGTPVYISPEQIRAEIASESSDVCARSVMLYELPAPL